MPVAANATVCIDSAHPALPGHFPGMPVVPGVVLLSHVVAQWQQQAPQWPVSGIKKLKFLKLLFPDQAFTVEFAIADTASVRFKCWQEGELLAEGNLNLSAT
jgi:3-hydroxyacyl-[acyl-carrier-protein] dehydratase